VGPCSPRAVRCAAPGHARGFARCGGQFPFGKRNFTGAPVLRWLG
jgi:hypothetical protein